MLLVAKSSRVHLIKISLTGIYVMLGIVGHIGDTPLLYEEVCHKDSDAHLHYDTPSSDSIWACTEERGAFDF